MASLKEALESVPDFRERSGQRHELATTLTLMFLAVLSNANGLREMARWMAEQRVGLAAQFGLKRGQVPSYGTIRRILAGIDVERLEQALQEWASTALKAEGEEAWPGIAIDGKQVRHGAETGQPVVQLLSAFSHQMQGVLAQRAVKNKTNEIPTARHLLETLAVEGQVVTVDALHTQRQTAQLLVEKKPPT